MFEVGWAVGLEYSDGFSKPLPSVARVGFISLIVLGVVGLNLTH